MYEWRQRGWLGGAVALGVLAAGACTPVSPTPSTPSPSPTPVQSVVSGARTAVSAAATAVSPQVQYVVQVLTSILGGGVQLQMEQEPPNASNNLQVTSVRLRATDATGTFAGLDRNGREKTAEAVLLATSQFYPQATVDLLIVDGADRTLMTGSRAPGQPPKLDD